MPSSQTDIAQLRGVVRRHRVHFQVLPEREIVSHTAIQVGFDLRIWGAHDHVGNVFPGCSECAEVYCDLKSVAEAVLPADQGASRYVIEPFDRALYPVLEEPGTDEVLLQLKILHRHDALAPVGDCEHRCVRDIRARLEELGVREGELPREPESLAVAG